LAKERAAHDARATQARIVSMLCEVLPAYDRALVGSARILEHLHALGIRRRNGAPLPWRIVLRWRRDLGFPVLRGFWHRNSRSPSFTTQHAVAAWLLSAFSSDTGAPFRVGDRSAIPTDGKALQESGSSARSNPDRAQTAA
jgi:hypothetical protein